MPRRCPPQCERGRDGGRGAQHALVPIASWLAWSQEDKADGPAVPMWVIIALLVIVIGGSVFQAVSNIVNAKK